MTSIKLAGSALGALSLAAAGAAAEARGNEDCRIRTIDRGHVAEAIAIYSGRAPGSYSFTYSQHSRDSDIEIDQAGPVGAALRGPVEMSRIQIAKSPGERLTGFVPARDRGAAAEGRSTRPNVAESDTPLLVARLAVRDNSGRLICQAERVEHTYRINPGRSRR